jgi:hypothetical protein
MTGEQAAGAAGEEAARRQLRYCGCKILKEHPVVHGHTLDLLVWHPEHGDSLVEVKIWHPENPSGKDTVKKAIADAYDLRHCGETRAYLLVISHRLTGLLGDMLDRAVDAGAITAVLVPDLVTYRNRQEEP